MRKILYRALLLCVGLSATITADIQAKVKLPRILTDGMVVQREHPVKLWGTADPGECVTIKVIDNKGKTVGAKKGVSTVANEDGTWIISIPALKVGGPYVINVNDEKISDVLSGDVYLCSGQSNMELAVTRVTDMFGDEIAAYSNTNIRSYNVPKVTEFHTPLNDLSGGKWKTATQDNVMLFSALGYFLAKDLNARTGVPVGIINSSWGGTHVESWISEEYIKDFPHALNEKRFYEDDGYRDRIKQLENENFARWNATMYRSDAGLHGEKKWFDPTLDDSSWQVVDLFSTNWATDGINPVNGSHWFRKTINIPADKAGKSAILRMGCIVDVDSVFINGKFVGTTSYQYPPRIYKVPEGLLKAGENNITVRLISQNGYPHFVKEKPYKLIVDGDAISLEGDWRYRMGTYMIPGPVMEFFAYKPVSLYNSMIHPLINYTVDGVVWYQGESNVERSNEYAALLEAMIKNWRADFNASEMPFYIVELADYLPYSDVAGRAAWEKMRGVQAQVADETPNAYLIPNKDLGEWNDIHPLNKKTLGERVVNAILNQRK